MRRLRSAGGGTLAGGDGDFVEAGDFDFGGPAALRVDGVGFAEGVGLGLVGEDDQDAGRS